MTRIRRWLRLLFEVAGALSTIHWLYWLYSAAAGLASGIPISTLHMSPPLLLAGMSSVTLLTAILLGRQVQRQQPRAPLVSHRDHTTFASLRRPATASPSPDARPAATADRTRRNAEEHRQLGELLRDMRYQRGLTQGQLAERLGVRPTFIGNYERGERRLDVTEMAAVKEALGAAPPRARLRRLLRERVDLWKRS